jgi:hypothetical protein
MQDTRVGVGVSAILEDAGEKRRRKDEALQETSLIIRLPLSRRAAIYPNH